MKALHRHYNGSPTRRSSAGVVLIISLFILLAITLMALGSMQSLGLGEKMAGNFKDRQVAFQAAEATLRDAERAIVSDTDGPFNPLRSIAFTADCKDALCRSARGTSVTSNFTDSQWIGTKTWALGEQTGAASLPGVASTPTYVIEFQGTDQEIEPGKPCVGFFLITARASGGQANTQVTLQTMFRHRPGKCYDAVY
jgi:type IV pilus assembly protein PilX